MNQSEIDALYNQFRSGGKAVPSTTDIDSLYNQFRNPSASPQQSVAPTTVAPSVPQPNPADFPIQADPVAPQPTTDIGRYAQRSVEGIGRLFKEAPRGAVRIAAEYPGNVGTAIWDEVKSGAKTFYEGLGDIGERRSASGVVKMGMGLLQGATSIPVGFAKETIGVPIANLTGNPQAGKAAEFAATAALPILPTANAIRKSMPSNKATAALVDAIGPDNIRAAVAAVRENPRLSLMDVAPGARMMGQGLTVTKGPHQTAFDNFVRERTEGAKAAVKDAYDTTMGAPVNVQVRLNELKEAAKKVGQNEIEPAIRGAGAVNINPVVKYIDDLEKPGVNSVITAGQALPSPEIVKALVDRRKFLTDGKSFREDAKSLHDMQAAVRAEADNLLNSANGQDRLLGRSLMDFRNRIVNQIDEASGGKYKQALSKYRDEMQVQAAFDRGATLNRNRDSVWEDHPDFVREWIKGLSKQELEAAKQGARLAFDRAVGRSNDPRGQRGTQLVNMEYNLEKSKMLFGEKEVNEMAKKLSSERAIAQTNQDLTGGSQTAMRQGVQASIPQRISHNEIKKDYVTPAIALLEGASHATGFGATFGLVTAAHMLNSRIGNRVRANIGNRLTNRQNTETTRLLQATAADDVVLNKLLDYASTVKPKLTQRVGSALSRVVQPLIP